MKLAEALKERADLVIKTSELERRIELNALVQEGEKTAEDPKKLLKELDECFSRLEYLIQRINITNSNVKVGKETITELIAKKDVLQAKLSAYKSISYEASNKTRRARGTEIKISSALSVDSLQKEISKLSKELREVDNLLQETNWTTDLL